MKEKRGGILKIAGVLFVIILSAVLTYFAICWVLSLRDPQKLADFRNFIDSLGFGGWLLLLAIQYIQIVIAFIPGGPIQIIAGGLFGPAIGLLTCILGMFLATATVFWLVNRYGPRIIKFFLKEKEIKQYSFLSDTRRIELLVVLLFLIPGTPKDALTYLFALTPIKMSRFMLLSTVARIPAALTSVLAGDSIVNGEWLKAVIYFAVITAISLGGLVLHRKILDVYKSRKN